MPDILNLGDKVKVEMTGEVIGINQGTPEQPMVYVRLVWPFGNLTTYFKPSELTKLVQPANLDLESGNAH